MIPETAPELISYMRNVGGLSVKLTAAGTVSIKPQKNLTQELKEAIARVTSEIRTVLEKERCPVDRDPKDTRRMKSTIQKYGDDFFVNWAGDDGPIATVLFKRPTRWSK